MYILLVLFVNPFYEFGVNDDWLYKLNVDSFLTGDFGITALLDATSIFHVLLGYFWALIFGASFVSLRLLTVVQTIFLLVGVNYIAKHFTKSKNKLYAILLLILSNPILFTSSLSFMSEISFLLFTVWSVYFFLKSNGRNNSYMFLFIGSIFAGFTILIRQIGFVLFIAYFVTHMILFVKNKRPLVKTQSFFSWNKKIDSNFIKKILIVFFIMIFFTIVWTIWPRYDFNVQGSYQTGISDLFSKIIQPNQILKRLQRIMFIPIYLGYFLSPVIVSLFIGKRSKISIEKLFANTKSFLFTNERLWAKAWGLSAGNKKMNSLLFIFLVLFLSHFIFINDIFPIGNVFYIEGLYIKSNFRNNFSLFDNVTFKFFISTLISFSISYTVLFLTRITIRLWHSKLKYFPLLSKSYKQKFNLDTTKISFNFGHLYMFFVTLGLLTSSFLGNDFYERYLLPFFVFFVVLVILYSNKIYLNIGFFLVLSIIILHMVIVQYDFNMHTNLRWQQGEKLMKSTGYVSSLYVDGVFYKYQNAVRNKDYIGRFGYGPRGKTYKCFVSKYTLDTDSKLLNFTQGLDDYLQKFVDNPRIYDSKKIHGLSRAKNNLNNLALNKKYYSPLYNFVGKNAYVGSWCLDDNN